MQCLEENEYTIHDLLTLLSESNIDSRWRAAAALGRAGSQAVDPLLKKLFDDDENVRVLAIWALGRIGDSRAIDPIARTADCDSGPVALAAEGALSRIRK
jgi:HEAT repeat protein